MLLKFLHILNVFLRGISFDKYVIFGANMILKEIYSMLSKLRVNYINNNKRSNLM